MFSCNAMSFVNFSESKSQHAYSLHNNNYSTSDSDSCTPTLSFRWLSKTLGLFNSKGADFVNARATIENSVLISRFLLTIQRFNAVCFNGSFCFNNADLDS